MMSQGKREAQKKKSHKDRRRQLREAAQHFMGQWEQGLEPFYDAAEVEQAFTPQRNLKQDLEVETNTAEKEVFNLASPKMAKQ